VNDDTDTINDPNDKNNNGVLDENEGMTYDVILLPGTGYDMVSSDPSSVESGSSYTFTLTIRIGFDGIPLVMANDAELTAVSVDTDDKVYTYVIENITNDVTVLVSGITPSESVASPDQEEGGESSGGSYLLAAICAAISALLLAYLFIGRYRY